MGESQPSLITRQCKNCAETVQFEAGRAGGMVECPRCGAPAPWEPGDLSARHSPGGTPPQAGKSGGPAASTRSPLEAGASGSSGGAASPGAKPAKTRYLSLDFWRGVACLMVVVTHSCGYATVSTHGQTPSAAAVTLVKVSEQFFAGVMLFFVISGYCIAAACDAIRARPRSATEFFLRRFKRIFPTYWAALLFYLALLGVLAILGVSWLILDQGKYPAPSPASMSTWQWLGTLTLTEEWRPHLGGGPMRWLLGQAWSLCYEEQFYAVCGLALFLSRRHFFKWMLGLTAGIAAFNASEILFRHLPGVKGFFFDGVWLEFAAGVWVYYRVQYLPARLRLPADLALLAATILATLAQLKFDTNYGWWTVIAWGFALVLCVLHRWDIPMARSKLLRPVFFAGLMCYSLYLIHGPVTKVIAHLLCLAGVWEVWGTLLVTFPLCIAGAVAASWMFHLAIERRFLNTPAVMAYRLVEPRPAAAPPQTAALKP